MADDTPLTHFKPIPLQTLYHNFGLHHIQNPTHLISDKTALLLSFLRVTDEFGLHTSIPDVYDETDHIQELERAYNFFIMDQTYALTPTDILRDVLFRCAEMSQHLTPTLRLFNLEQYIHDLFLHVQSRYTIKKAIRRIIATFHPADIEKIGSNLMSALSYHLNDGRIFKAIEQMQQQRQLQTHTSPVNLLHN